MTEQELSEKIVGILRYHRDDFIEENYRRDIERIDFEALANVLISEGIGDVSEWKQRAEVAERKIKIRDIALLEMAEIIDWDRGTDDETPEEYVKYHLQKAEKELQEERKDEK